MWLLSGTRRITRATTMAFALLVLPSFSVITAVKQVAYNQYQITSTGGGAIELLDDEDQVLPSTTAGNIVTLSDWQTHGNNVKRARQGGVKFNSFDTWRDLYLRASNDNTDRRQITEGKGDPNGNFQQYTPLMTVATGNPSTLTITAPKAAPIFNQATMGGTVLSVHKPGHSDYAYTPATGTFSVTVALPSTYTTSSPLQACALINDLEKSCTEMPYSSPSPPSPPSPPPSPPVPPPRPQPPPSPVYPPFPPAVLAPQSLTANTWTTATFVPVGVVVALLLCVGFCWYHRKKIHSAATKNKGSKLRGSAMQEVGVVPPPKAPAVAVTKSSSKKPAAKAEEGEATSSTKDSSEAPKDKDLEEQAVEEPAEPAAESTPESTSKASQPVTKEESVENI